MNAFRLRKGAASDAPAQGHEAEFTAWIAAGAPAPAAGTALVVPNDADLSALPPGTDLSGFAEIVLSLPRFRDGRAYSQARRLRDQHGFAGDIRVRGDVGRDQALFLYRVGVTVFEADEARRGGLIEALGEFSAFYQTAADGVAPVWRRRRARSLAA